MNSAISQREAGKGPQYAVFHKATMCGVCGFHPFDVTNKTGGIGYWLSQAYTGKGITTSSVKALNRHWLPRVRLESNRGGMRHG
ncbi:GNAT family N-acetyltransferase [Chromohalobacter canadensis]|uniref:GNAT family N-acetyltransferase n=1 Tax=Chromohalobacter canadensis TaxID=141389 RepID=UPI000BE37032